MRRYRAQMAVVMDQHGGTAGLVTMEDLFEEVIGDIEEGRGRAAIVPRGRTAACVCAARCGSTKSAKALDWPLEHPKVTTVSGLVLLLLGRPALLGDVVTWNQVRVEVTKVAGRGVAEAMMTRDGATVVTRSNVVLKVPDDGIFDLVNRQRAVRSPVPAT